jgi:hypothetical protein
VLTCDGICRQSYYYKLYLGIVVAASRGYRITANSATFASRMDRRSTEDPERPSSPTLNDGQNQDSGQSELIMSSRRHAQPAGSRTTRASTVIKRLVAFVLPPARERDFAAVSASDAYTAKSARYNPSACLRIPTDVRPYFSRSANSTLVPDPIPNLLLR